MVDNNAVHKTFPPERTRSYHEVDTIGFGRWLINQLDRAGHTQSWLAKRLSVNVCTMSGYVTGKHMPRLTTVWRICKILDADFMTACSVLEQDLMLMRYPEV